MKQKDKKKRHAPKSVAGSIYAQRLYELAKGKNYCYITCEGDSEQVSLYFDSNAKGGWTFRAAIRPPEYGGTTKEIRRYVPPQVLEKKTEAEQKTIFLNYVNYCYTDARQIVFWQRHGERVYRWIQENAPKEFVQSQLFKEVTGVNQAAYGLISFYDDIIDSDKAEHWLNEFRRILWHSNIPMRGVQHQNAPNKQMIAQ